MPAPTPTKKGLTTIVWGTVNAINSPAAAILESVQVTPKNGGPVAEIENGDGAGVALVMLADGFNAKVSAVYDANVAWPAEGANVGLTLPDRANANTAAVQYFCVCTAVSPPSLTRKKEAMISFDLIYRPGITA